MRAMFLEKRSISTLDATVAGAGSGVTGGWVTGCGDDFGSGGRTPGSCNVGLTGGSMTHLALDILPGNIQPSNFNHLTALFVRYIARAFPQRSLEVVDCRYGILFLHRQPASI